MKKYVITIAREFGCGAREIAKKLANELEIPLFDKELVDLVAEDIGVHIDLAYKSDEAVLEKRNRNLLDQFGYGSTTDFYSETALEAQERVILELANRNMPCIIFGRCADYVLREHPNILKTFLYASPIYKIKYIADTYSLDYNEAEKLINRVDKQRHNYYKYVTGHNRGDRIEKDLMLDVSVFGCDGCIKMIKEAKDYLFDND